MALRAFKAAWFAKAAKKARISDALLCRAMAQVIDGQADDLGGGVFKKRLGDNNYRSIILARGRDYWVYEYLFAKQDRANIEPDELKAFRALAKGYGALTTRQVEQLLADRDLFEICVGTLDMETGS